MLILVIDIGSKNVGLSMIRYSNEMANIICIKDTWIDLNYAKMEEIYEKYHFSLLDVILLEQQIKGIKNIFYLGFLSAYFQSKNKNVYIVKPYTYGMKIKSYRKRKNVSITLFKKVMNNANKLTILSKNSKIDDISDATCLGLKWLKIDIDKIIINSLQIA